MFWDFGLIGDDNRHHPAAKPAELNHYATKKCTKQCGINENNNKTKSLHNSQLYTPQHHHHKKLFTDL